MIDEPLPRLLPSLAGTVLGVVYSFSFGCAAQTPSVAEPSSSETGSSETGAWTFAPKDLIYPVYVADPRRPTFGLVSLTTSDSDIEGAGEGRFEVRMGARFGILRHGRESDTVGAFQLDGEIGFLGQFDRDNSTDNIGWDGLYGAFLSWRTGERVALQVGVKHDSSHIGDEFIEATGRTRINYTREEITAGVSYDLAAAWRTYGEYGWAYDLRNEDLMERGRAQAGLEYESAPIWKSNLMAPYVALDVNSYQENDWDANVSLQLGVLWRTSGKGSVWRLGLEFYDGRSRIGEFFQEDESYIGFGAWLDP